MAVTPTTFKVRYPEFSSVDDSRIQLFIDDATLEMSEEKWGDLYDRGLSALAAHLLAIATQNAASGGTGASIGGEIASRAVGSVSVSFTTSNSMDSSLKFYMSTAYGAEYWRLVLLVGVGWVAIW